jgi:hypothetical protein
MKAKQLTEVITDDGIPWVNFFNGRLLSGEDLSSEQNSHRTGQRRLGQAIGDGIVSGLEVSVPQGVNTLQSPLVKIEPGLALNRQGQALALAQTATISLTSPSTDKQIGSNIEAFEDCLPLQTGNYIASAGVYLLTIAPARRSQGRAPVSGLDNLTARCNTRYNVEGIQFRLLQLNLDSLLLQDAMRLRNRVAYQCFGLKDETSETLQSELFKAPFAGDGLLDALRPTLLTDCDVPLALINWTTASGIAFIDLWSVRRRVQQPSASGRWSGLSGERRRSEGEAMFLQFEEHIQSLAQATNLQTLKAVTNFSYLPPVGIIPHMDSLSGQGFDYRMFFDGLTYREPVFIEGAKVESLFRMATAYAPTELRTGEMMWLYWVKQNLHTIDAHPATPPQAYLIFTSGHVPYQGEAHYDLAHWNYANYA